MKRVVSILLVLAMLFTLMPAVIAEEGQNSDFEISGNKLIRYTGSSSSVTVPAEVEVIGSGAFLNNRNITSVRFAGEVTAIQSQAFAGCSKLARVSFADLSKLESIGSYAFAGCLPLNPSWAANVKSVVGNAFDGCNVAAQVATTTTNTPPVVQLDPTATPAPTATPVATEAPVVVTEAPVATEAPVVVTEAPAATEAPVVVTEAPAVTDAPVVVTEAPAATEAPVVVTEAPVVTDAPVVSAESTLSGGSREQALEIVVQPTDQNADVGDNVTFSFEAAGSGLKYQWQFAKANTDTWYNSGLNGYNTNTLSFTVTDLHVGNSYRCRVSDENGNVIYSDAAKLLPTEEEVELAIVTQPTAQNADVGDTVTFTLTAQGTNLAYQWQFAKANTDTWYNSGLGGYNTNTLSFTVTDLHVGNSYRCKITDGSGNVIYSDSAQLLAKVEFKITEQPTAQRADVGDSVTFSLSAEGKDLKYQWQFAKENTDTWYNSGLNGYNTDTLSFTVTDLHVGNSYRCKITDANGTVIYSDPAQLLPSVEFKITGQPTAQYANVGDSVTFSLTAEGVDLKYQWQFAKANTDTWYNSGLGGYNTDTLSFTVTDLHVGNSYRCKITDATGSVIYSEPAQLLPVETAEELAIVTQPTDQSADVGDTVTFTLTAQGTDLVYQWQFAKANTDTWYNSGLGGYDTDTLSFTVTDLHVGNSYRCKITDGSGNVIYSDPAQLLPTVELKITEQPTAQYANVGDDVTFALAAEGDSLKYQWQFAKENTDVWYNSGLNGYNTDTLSFTVTDLHVGNSYRCKITDASGNVIYSDPAQLLPDDSEVIIDGVIYSIEEDYVVVIGYEGTATSVTVAADIEGIPVTRIGESAFEGNTTLTSIDLPDSIQTIGRRAFANCTSLSNID